MPDDIPRIPRAQADKVRRVAEALKRTLPETCIPPEFVGYSDLAVHLVIKMNGQGLIVVDGVRPKVIASSHKPK